MIAILFLSLFSWQSSASDNRCAQILNLSAFREQRETQKVNEVRSLLKALRSHTDFNSSPYSDALVEALRNCSNFNYVLPQPAADTLSKLGFLDANGRVHQRLCVALSKESEELAQELQTWIDTRDPRSLEKIKNRILDDRFDPFKN